MERNVEFTFCLSSEIDEIQTGTAVIYSNQLQPAGLTGCPITERSGVPFRSADFTSTPLTTTN